MENFPLIADGGRLILAKDLLPCDFINDYGCYCLVINFVKDPCDDDDCNCVYMNTLAENGNFRKSWAFYKERKIATLRVSQ